MSRVSPEPHVEGCGERESLSLARANESLAGSSLAHVGVCPCGVSGRHLHLPSSCWWPSLPSCPGLCHLSLCPGRQPPTSLGCSGESHGPPGAVPRESRDAGAQLRQAWATCMGLWMLLEAAQQAAHTEVPALPPRGPRSRAGGLPGAGRCAAGRLRGPEQWGWATEGCGTSSCA